MKDEQKKNIFTLGFTMNGHFKCTFTSIRFTGQVFVLVIDVTCISLFLSNFCLFHTGTKHSKVSEARKKSKDMA